MNDMRGPNEFGNDVVPVAYRTTAMPLAMQGPVATDAPEFSFLQTVFRRKLLIAAIAFGITISATIGLAFVTPWYTAAATVLLEFHQTPLMRITSLQTQLPSDYVTDTLALSSQLEIVRSRTLARTVAEKLHLENLPEFNPGLDRGAAPVLDAGRMLRGIRDWAAHAAGEPASDATSVGAETPLDRAVSILQRHVSIINNGKSYVVNIVATSKNPQLAGEIANTYAAAYLDQERNAKVESTRVAAEWLNDQVVALQDKVRNADEAVQSYKVANHLVESRGATVTGQQVTELNSQLTLAAADRAQKEARLRAVTGLARSRSATFTAAPDVLASPLIQNLRQQEAELDRRAAEMSTRYGPRYPAIVNISAQLEDLRGRISTEINKIISGLQTEVDAARARERTLQATLSQVQNVASGQQLAQSRLQEMEREADSSRSLLQAYLARQKEAVAQQSIQQPDARLITAATTPIVPSWPQKTVTAIAIFSGSTILASLIALVLEMSQNRFFRSAVQLEQVSGFPALGLVPELKRNDPLRGHDSMVGLGDSTYSEAVRSIFVRLQVQRSPPQVILVTSSVPDEGKTFFSVSLARSVALTGRRTLLIDCDTRRPSVAKLLRPERHRESGSLVEIEPTTSLNYFAEAITSLDPRDAGNVRSVWETINGARDAYDVIVVDSPPIVPFSDAVSLSHLADATLLLTRWSHTPAKVVITAMRELNLHGAGQKWAILTRVDLRKQARYGFGDISYFHRRYGGYYARGT